MTTEARFPLPFNTGRVDGRAFPLAESTGRQHGPSTRLVETGLDASTVNTLNRLETCLSSHVSNCLFCSALCSWLCVATANAPIQVLSARPTDSTAHPPFPRRTNAIFLQNLFADNASSTYKLTAWGDLTSFWCYNAGDDDTDTAVWLMFGRQRRLESATCKGRFPLPEFTARVHGPRTRPVNSDAFFDTRELGPWTRVVETDLNSCASPAAMIFQFHI